MLIILKKSLLCITGLLLIGSVNSIKAEERNKVGSSVHTESLLRSSTSWDGKPYKAYPEGAPELSVLKITIPPHTPLPWHAHPMPNAAYVLSGELAVEKKSTGEKRLLTAGQVLPEMVGELHRGVSGDAPTVLIVFYAGTKGMPLSRH